ncbi:MAG: hypothetical protein BA867_09030 [Desulfobacterales bacterium S5133MH16]|nr:MAG: hypothetical protein BA867_09030 [Desulfobacterales bacterium S5133MH16]
MEQGQEARDRTQEAAWARAEGAAVEVVVLVPGPTDLVSAQIVVKKYLTNWELPVMSRNVLSVKPP